MARKRLNLANMIYKLEFGHFGNSEKVNPNTGKPIKNVFTPEFVRWASKDTLTSTELISLAGANIKNAVKFSVRHDESITSDYILRLNDELFEIDLINYGEGNQADAYDRITAHKIVRKHG